MTNRNIVNNVPNTLNYTSSYRLVYQRKTALKITPVVRSFNWWVILHFALFFFFLATAIILAQGERTQVRREKCHNREEAQSKSMAGSHTD